jgi:hypothetical protein
MKPVLFETLRARANGCKVTNKLLARCIFQIINTFSPCYKQGVHDLIYTVEIEASRYKLAAKQKYLVMVCADCVRFGWTQRIAGKVTSKVTLPTSVDRRWKTVCLVAMSKGMAVAVKQLTPQHAVCQ